ncbi:hypothetical protein D3C71_2119590 [compost metagenome]
MPVLAAAFLESGQIRLVAGLAVCLARFTLPANAFAFDVAQVCDGGARTRLAQVHHPGVGASAIVISSASRTLTRG